VRAWADPQVQRKRKQQHKYKLLKEKPGLDIIGKFILRWFQLNGLMDKN
jgi:hypothetical protein